MSASPAAPFVPNLIAAVYGNGRTEARLRGTDTVVADAPDT